MLPQPSVISALLGETGCKDGGIGEAPETFSLMSAVEKKRGPVLNEMRGEEGHERLPSVCQCHEHVSWHMCAPRRVLPGGSPCPLKHRRMKQNRTTERTKENRTTTKIPQPFMAEGEHSVPGLGNPSRKEADALCPLLSKRMARGPGRTQAPSERMWSLSGHGGIKSSGLDSSYPLVGNV